MNRLHEKKASLTETHVGRTVARLLEPKTTRLSFRFEAPRSHRSTSQRPPPLSPPGFLVEADPHPAKVGCAERQTSEELGESTDIEA